MQGYFVYDSKKSGSQTVSHLRFGPRADPVHVPRAAASSSAVTSSSSSRRWTCSAARRGRDLAAQQPADARRGVGLPAPARYRTGSSRSAGWRSGSSTPTRSRARSASAARPTACCRRASSPYPVCCPARRRSTGSRRPSRRPTAGKGKEVVRNTRRSIARSRGSPGRGAQQVTATREMPPPVPAGAPAFVRAVIAEMLAGRGDGLPVSAFPIDGTFPSGTTAWRSAASPTSSPCGTRALHPVRQLFVRLPARRDPPASLRLVGAGRRARRVPSAPSRPAGSRTAATRCKSTKRTAPGARCVSRRAR